MKYAICPLSFVHGRREASSKTECVTQILFGEHLQILEATDKWARVQLAYDQYECWIELEQLQALSDAEFEALQNHTPFLTSDLAAIATREKDGETIKLTLGCPLPFFDAENNTFRLGADQYRYHGTVVKQLELSSENAAPYLNFFRNAPYLWGGRTPFGTDCSGFVQNFYRLFGVALKRDAYQQAEQGETIAFAAEAQFGDLAFFDNFDSETGRITHVGLITETGTILHAAGQVREDKFDHQGIYNDSLGEYTHRLRVIKRFR